MIRKRIVVALIGLGLVPAGQTKPVTLFAPHQTGHRPRLLPL